MSWRKFKGYYVYTYLDENSEPYYVGMGCKNRVVVRRFAQQNKSIKEI